MGIYIYFRRMCCPQPHRPITLVTLLTKETRRYSETQVPIYQRTWRRILEDKSFPVSGTVLNAARSKACGAVCCSNNINIYIYINIYLYIYVLCIYVYIDVSYTIPKYFSQVLWLRWIFCYKIIAQLIVRSLFNPNR